MAVNPWVSEADQNRTGYLTASGAATAPNLSGVVGAMGAINPKSGSRFPDFVEQWHVTHWPARE